MSALQVPYGYDVPWNDGEIAVFRIYHELTKAQAKAIAAWNAAQMRGEDVGPRPVTVLALEMKARAEAMLAEGAV